MVMVYRSELVERSGTMMWRVLFVPMFLLWELCTMQNRTDATCRFS